MSQQSFLKSLQAALTKPATLAFIASTGFHGLLYVAALPQLSGDYQLGQAAAVSNSRAGVGLLELSPSEIARLPDLSPPPPPPPPPELSVPPINSQLPNINELLPSRPVSPTLPPPPLALAPNLRLPLPNRNRTRRFNVPLPPPPTISNPIPIPRNRNLTRTPVAPPTNSQVPSADEMETRMRLFPGLREGLDEIAAARQRQQANQNQNLPGPLPGATFEPFPQPAEGNQNNTPNAQPSLTPEQIAAQREENRIASAKERIEALRNDYRPSQNNTSKEEANINAAQWQVNSGVAEAKVEPESSSFAGNYPRTACRLKLQGTVTTTYGILVNTNGRVMDANLKLLRSAGYPIFDQQALREIRGRSFPNQIGQPKPYYVSVNFTPQAQTCGSPNPQPVAPQANPGNNTTPKPPQPQVNPRPQPTTPQPQEVAPPRPQPRVAPEPPAPVPVNPPQPQVTPEPPAPPAPKKPPAPVPVNPPQPQMTPEPPTPPAPKKPAVPAPQPPAPAPVAPQPQAAPEPTPAPSPEVKKPKKPVTEAQESSE